MEVEEEEDMKEEAEVHHREEDLDPTQDIKIEEIEVVNSKGLLKVKIIIVVIDIENNNLSQEVYHLKIVNLSPKEEAMKNHNHRSIAKSKDHHRLDQNHSVKSQRIEEIHNQKVKIKGHVHVLAHTLNHLMMLKLMQRQ